MKYLIRKSAIVTLALLLVFCFAVSASADTIDVTAFTIDNSAADKTVVTWDSSADKVLKAEAEAGNPATMTIACKFGQAYALYVTGDRIVPASIQDGKITFEIPGAGTYHILQGVTYTVTYNANGHGTAPEGETVISGGKAAKPTDPTAAGYTFGGWYTDAACTEANMWDFETDTVTGNITLYAKWTEAAVQTTHTVAYNANGHGTAPAGTTVASGSKLAKPADPTAAGYTFGGWYTDAACTEANKWDFTNDTVTENITLYAKWVLNAVTGVKVSPETVTLNRGATHQFAATVSGTGTFDSGITWSVSGNKSSDTKIDANGKLTVASGETATTLKVTATSRFDATKSGSATVTVRKPTVSANTGDSFNPMLWVALMILCAAGAVVLILVRKKRK